MADYYSKYLDMVNSEKNKYRGAGFVFYQQNGLDFDFLLGVTQINTLSVFGGGRDKKDPSSLYTAVREVFEEVFNVLPNGVDLVVSQIQKKLDDYSIIEKTFIKESNEVCYFANINILNIFIEHLIYHECEWTFKDKHKWSEYFNNLYLFINDRVLKNNQKAKNGINEIKKIVIINWKNIDKSVKYNTPITINKKDYLLRDNLNRYFEENIIMNIINKNNSV